MNWQSYKNLTNEQKEEYNFRFKDEISFSSYGLLTSITNLFLISLLFVFMIFIIMKDEQFAQYKDSISTYVSSIGNIFYGCGILVIGFASEYLFRVLNRWYSYRKWIKENNIIMIYWWTKWFK